MRNMRSTVRLSLLVGVVLLSIAAGLALWDLSSDGGDDEPVPITGQVDQP